MLAVVGGKGGVGTTTTALGLTAALAREEGRPLIVDCDTEMPDAARRLGARATAGLAAVAEPGPAPVGLARIAPPTLDGGRLLPGRAGSPVAAALDNS